MKITEYNGHPKPIVERRGSRIFLAYFYTKVLRYCLLYLGILFT
jgi:hypothetical protein